MTQTAALPFKSKMTEVLEAVPAEHRDEVGRWPQSLMVASMGGALVVIPTYDHDRIDGGDGIEPSSVLAAIDGIPNTGGDW